MNFNLNENQLMIRDLVREFADKEIAPHTAPSRRVNRRSTAPRPVRPPRLHVNVRGYPAAIDTMRAMVVQAATTAATANREAAEAWDALATHAAG